MFCFTHEASETIGCDDACVGTDAERQRTHDFCQSLNRTGDAPEPAASPALILSYGFKPGYFVIEESSTTAIDYYSIMVE
jgi:hypothetical protein